jgi:hypothetical protein
VILANRRRRRLISAVCGGGDLHWISGYGSVKESRTPALWWHQDWWCSHHPISLEPSAAQVALPVYLSGHGRTHWGATRAAAVASRQRAAPRAAADAHALGAELPLGRRPLLGARLEARRDGRADRLHGLVAVAPRSRNHASHMTRAESARPRNRAWTRVPSLVFPHCSLGRNESYAATRMKLPHLPDASAAAGRNAGSGTERYMAKARPFASASAPLGQLHACDEAARVEREACLDVFVNGDFPRAAPPLDPSG